MNIEFRMKREPFAEQDAREAQARAMKNQDAFKDRQPLVLCEEAFLRDYLRSQGWAGGDVAEAAISLEKEAAGLREALNEATVRAEANGGWGEKAGFRVRACNSIDEMVQAHKDGVHYPYFVGVADFREHARQAQDETGTASDDLHDCCPVCGCALDREVDESPIQAGAVVTLRSGGPAMTVSRVEDGVADLLWHGEDGKILRDHLLVEMLDHFD